MRLACHRQRALQSYAEPPGPDEIICQARGSRGGNKVDVLLPDGFQALVILPAKFRKQIWIRKGSFVIVQVTADEENEKGERTFNGEIVRVLLKDDEKHLRTLEGGTYWPERWCVSEPQDGDDDADGVDAGEEEEGADEGEKTGGEVAAHRESSDSEEELPEHLRRVSNRRRMQYQDDSSDSD